MRTISLIALVTLSACGFAQEPALKIPAEVKATPGRLGEIKAETTGKVVKWVALTPGLDVRTYDGGKTLIFSGLGGRYELLAYTAAGDVPSDPARVVVVIDLPEPLPPPPPKPDTRLKDKLRAALDSEPWQKADVVQLVAVYRTAAKVATAKDPATKEYDVPTSRELMARVRKVSDDLLRGTDVLFAVRVAAAEEILAALGMTSDEPLTDAQRAKAAEVYLKLATALEEIVK